MGIILVRHLLVEAHWQHAKAWNATALNLSNAVDDDQNLVGWFWDVTAALGSRHYQDPLSELQLNREELPETLATVTNNTANVNTSPVGVRAQDKAKAESVRKASLGEPTAEGLNNLGPTKAASINGERASSCHKAARMT
jgi:hypothetical protein